MIRSKQISYYINQAVDEILKKGSIPTKEEVMRVYSRKVKSEPGLPTVRPLDIPKYSVSNPKALSDCFDAIYKDLYIAFSENSDQMGQILSLFNYYEIEKERLFAHLDSQLSRVRAIKEDKGTFIDGEIFSCYFEDFTNIDYLGDEVRGIPLTSCFVDLRQLKATNWRRRTKININSAEYSVKPLSDFVESTPLFPFEMSIKDTVSEAWIHKVTSKETSSKIEVILSFNEIIEANSVVYTLITTKPVSIDLYLSTDGTSFAKQHEITISRKTAEWNFLKQEIKAIKFVITKPEPDGINGMVYDYYFAAQNISVFNDTYLDKGVLTSVPIPVHNANKVKLHVNQMIYPKTSIKYFICKDDNKNVEWLEIEPENELTFSTFAYTGNIRLMAIFYNSQYAPQLNNYTLLIRGDFND